MYPLYILYHGYAAVTILIHMGMLHQIQGQSVRQTGSEGFPLIAGWQDSVRIAVHSCQGTECYIRKIIVEAQRNLILSQQRHWVISLEISLFLIIELIQQMLHILFGVCCGLNYLNNVWRSVYLHIVIDKNNTIGKSHALTEYVVFKHEFTLI